MAAGEQKLLSVARQVFPHEIINDKVGATIAVGHLAWCEKNLGPCGTTKMKGKRVQFARRRWAVIWFFKHEEAFMFNNVHLFFRDTKDAVMFKMLNS